MTFRLLLFRGLLPLFALVGTLNAVPTKFEISAQPAPDALRLFIKQSGTEVLFIQEDLANSTTNAVTGEFEPEAALNALLENTGLAAKKSRGGKFTVASTVPKPGIIEGEVREDKSGKPVVGAKIQVAGSGKSATTDKRGRFVIEDVAAGSQVLLIAAEGMQNTKVTDVDVTAGHRLSLSPIGIPVQQSGPLQLDPYSVSAKKNDGMIELDPYSVEGRKEKPFVGGNMDIPRTINDAQPYYIFDAKTIDQSGAVNIEQFLKQRLTMNASALSNSQDQGTSATLNRGNTSEFNLRGLSADKTLILVNGRRQAGITLGTQDYQADLNGIPPSAVERIEVLPTSASGIYGGSAIGGVINVILKKDYAGGEIRATYDNTFNPDSPARTLALTYGVTPDHGKTHIMASAAWSDSSPLLFLDRRDIFERNLAVISRNSPDYFAGSGRAFLGASPNITPFPTTDTLVLKTGQSLGSNITFISPGTPPTVTEAELAAMLLANAGKWNRNLPLGTQAPYGLLRPFGVTPETKSFALGIRRKIWERLEIFADLAYRTNDSTLVINPFPASAISVPSNSMHPFANSLAIVSFASNYSAVNTYASRARSITVGANAQLPFEWTGEFDYSYSDSAISAYTYGADTGLFFGEMISGRLNVMFDTLMYPVDLSKYRQDSFSEGSSKLHDFNIRGHGPLISLPWGSPLFTIGLGHRLAIAPAQSSYRTVAGASTQDEIFNYYRRDQETTSGYGEITVPLLRRDIAPLLHVLEFQTSGRLEYYTVSAGTPYQQVTPSGVSYGAPTLNDQPYFTDTSYNARSYTVGLKYQPIPELAFRVSQATAFLPPRPEYLIPNPTLSTDFVTDPRNPSAGFQEVQVIDGGNPDLKPENSKSLNAGFIFEPQGPKLRGLRINVEYYRIRQFDAIAFLGAQGYVDREDIYPDRVTRNTSGMITVVNTGPVNLFKKETEGFDLNLSYRLETGAGMFTLDMGESIIRHLKTQYLQSQPDYEAAGYHPAEEGAPKRKSVVTLTWERGNWSAGWSTRRVGSYKLPGAVGGPTSIQFADGGIYQPEFYIKPQGSDTVEAQAYHDCFVSFAVRGKQSAPTSKFQKWRGALLAGMSVQVGVRNVFNTTPPLDLGYAATSYASPFGDMRLRSYWVSLRKQF